VKGGSQRQRRKRRATPGVLAGRSPLVAAVAALALLFQFVAIPYHQARSAPIAPQAASDVASVAAALKATFGDAAALCVQSDGRGGPDAPAGDCDDHCPLCQFAAEAAALIAPDLPALPARFDLDVRTLGAAPEASAVPRVPIRHNRARGPPFPL
jgi:hypothetical protein